MSGTGTVLIYILEPEPEVLHIGKNRPTWVLIDPDKATPIGLIWPTQSLLVIHF
jgi:hypothetical protein